ncbi:MAG TPA: Hpt domain-containing protein [Rhizomicrobium sp.]|nr:Hpt domain-containing protein [Rhizomicrobium sp.]
MNDHITKPFQHALLPAKLPLLDTTNLEDLGTALPLDSLADLVTLYRHDAEGQMGEISAYAKAGDLPGIARQAHMLVSSAGNLGALQTSALARNLEHFCQAGNPDGLAPLLDELGQSVAQSCAALAAWLDAKRASAQVSA